MSAHGLQAQSLASLPEDLLRELGAPSLGLDRGALLPIFLVFLVLCAFMVPLALVLHSRGVVAFHAELAKALDGEVELRTNLLGVPQLPARVKGSLKGHSVVVETVELPRRNAHSHERRLGGQVVTRVRLESEGPDDRFVVPGAWGTVERSEGWFRVERQGLGRGAGEALALVEMLERCIERGAGVGGGSG